MLFSKMKLFSFLFVALCIKISHAGGVSSNEDVNEVIDGHINRLLSLRQSNMGWYNTPSAVLALQLSKPQRFIRRKLSVDRMKQEVLNEKISMGKLALYAMASTSVCENPRKFSKVNLIKKIKNELKNATRETIIWYHYALAIQALCVNNATITKKEIVTILSSRNPHGGYGSSVDTTSQMLIAFKCMSEQSSLPHEMQRRVEEAVQLAGDYLEQQYNHDMGSLWIGNKYSTPIALSALQAVNRPLNSSIKNEVYESLLSCVFDDEPEGAVAQRLTALCNTTVLKLRHWSTCSPVTETTPTSTVTSQPEDLEDVSITFAVKLTVEVGSNRSTVVVENVEKGETLLQVMEQARDQGNFRFTTQNTAWGPFVVSINGVEANPSLRQYWSLIDANTEKPLTVGVGQYTLLKSEHILFRLSTY